MSAPESTPSFSLQKETRVKMPLGLLALIISAAVGATVYLVSLSLEVTQVRKELTECQRVNGAQDKRFEFLEAQQSDFAVLKNNVEWLERQERSRKP